MRVHLRRRPSGGAFLVAALAVLTAWTARAEPNPSTATRIASIDVSRGDGVRRVAIKTSGPPTFTVFRLQNPLRVVVDISGGDIRDLEGPIAVEDGVIVQITPQQFDRGKHRLARIIIGLAAELDYDVRAEGDAIMVRITESAGAVPVEDASPAVEVLPAVVEPSEDVLTPGEVGVLPNDTAPIVPDEEPAEPLAQQPVDAEPIIAPVDAATVVPDALFVPETDEALESEEPVLDDVSLEVEDDDGGAEELASATDVLEPAPAALPTPTPAPTSTKRLNFDAKDAEIVNMIRLIAQVSGRNIITAESVHGTVSLRLRQVPWEVALDTILKSHGLDYVDESDVIRIGDALSLQRQREVALARQRTEKEAARLHVKTMTLQHALASELESPLRGLLSPRGTLQAEPRTNTLIVEDTAVEVAKIEALLRDLDQPVAQVLIEAHVVEVAHAALSDLNIVWDDGTAEDTTSAQQSGLLFPPVVPPTERDDVEPRVVRAPAGLAVNLPSKLANHVSAADLVFGRARVGDNVALRLAALEAAGHGRILSSPRILTLDQRTARVAQGLDWVAETQPSQAHLARLSNRLDLAITPRVTRDGAIMLRIETEKVDPAKAAPDPAATVLRKSASTEVLLRNGETTVIGGLYARRHVGEVASRPSNAHIPFLGPMLITPDEADERAELLVFITPRVVPSAARLARVSPGAAKP